MAVKKLPGTIKAVVFDGDGTLLESENPYLELSKKLGCERESKKLVHAYLAHKILYRDLTDRESQLFVSAFRKRFERHPQQGDFERLLPPAIVREKAARLITILRKHGIEIIVIGSGLIDMLQSLIPLGISAAHISANRFHYDEQGNYRGRHIEVEGDKIVAFDKILYKHRLIGPNVAYVGDSDFDRRLFEHVLKIGGVAVLVEGKQQKHFPIRDKPYSKRFLVIDDLGQMEKLLSY